MELKKKDSHKKANVEDLMLKFKKDAFRIMLGINVALFSGATLVPHLQVYAKETQEEDALSEEEKEESINIEGWHGPGLAPILGVINEGRKSEGLPERKDKSEITKDDLEKYLKGVEFYLDKDIDLSGLKYCKNLESIAFGNIQINNIEKIKSIDYSQMKNLKSLYIYSLNTESAPEINSQNYEFIKNIDTLTSLRFDYPNLSKRNKVDIDFFYDLSSMPNLEEFFIPACLEYTPLDYTEIGKGGNLKNLYICGKPSSVAISLTSEEMQNLEDRGINVVFDNILYANNKEAALDRVKEINEKLSEIQKKLEIREDMTDEEKRDAIVLYITDTLEYDSEIKGRLKKGEDLTGNDLVEFNKDGFLYGALDRETQICQNYAALFNALAERLGLESYIIVSNNHAYNLVNIDDEYVFVDPTWLDEPGIADYIRENPKDAEEIVTWLNKDFDEVAGITNPDSSHYSYNIPKEILEEERSKESKSEDLSEENDVEGLPKESDLEGPSEEDHSEGLKQERTTETTTKKYDSLKIRDEKESEQKTNARDEKEKKEKTQDNKLYIVTIGSRILIVSGATLVGMIAFLKELKKRKKERENRDSKSEQGFEQDNFER